MAEQDPKIDYRRRLLDGFAQSIRERGLQRTGISDIVRNERTSKRTFYECFPNKESCLAELLDTWAAGILAAVGSAIDPEAAWEVQIESGVDAYLSALANDSAIVVTALRELPTLGERGVVLYQDDVDRYARLLMELTRGPQMRRAGVKPVEFETTVMLIGGIAELLHRATRAGRSPDSLADPIKLVIKLVIAPR